MPDTLSDLFPPTQTVDPFASLADIEPATAAAETEITNGLVFTIEQDPIVTEARYATVPAVSTPVAKSEDEPVTGVHTGVVVVQFVDFCQVIAPSYPDNVKLVPVFPVTHS